MFSHRQHEDIQRPPDRYRDRKSVTPERQIISSHYSQCPSAFPTFATLPGRRAVDVSRLLRPQTIDLKHAFQFDSKMNFYGPLGRGLARFCRELQRGHFIAFAYNWAEVNRASPNASSPTSAAIIVPDFYNDLGRFITQW